MNFEIKVNNSLVNVFLEGKMYVEDAAILREKLLQQMRDGRKMFLVDCRNLEYIDSSGLGVLVAIQKRALESGGGVTIQGLNGLVRDLFELTRLTKVFNIE